MNQSSAQSFELIFKINQLLILIELSLTSSDFWC